LKHVIAIAFLVIVTWDVVEGGLAHASSPTPDHFYLVGQVAIAGVIVLMALVFGVKTHIAKKPLLRNYCLVILLCAIAAGLIPFLTHQQRITETKANLEQAYDKLATQGPPFPPNVDLELRTKNRLLSHGYSVSPDRQRFELFYHVASDSFVLSFPKREWQVRGFNYEGPD
jgi:hypothetical protein